MTDETLIADLVRAGVAADLVGRVANALAVSSVRDNVRDMVREYERARKQKQRGNHDKSGGKQTMSASVSGSENAPNVPDIVPDNSGRRCDESSFLSSTSEVQRRKKGKKEEQASKRGTRMFVGAELSPAYWEFARTEGFADPQIGQMWREFVDFWVGVPGQRGLKLDWFATWRNRIRDVKNRRGTGTQNGARNPTMAAIDDLLARTENREVEGSPPMVDVTPRRA